MVHLRPVTRTRVPVTTLYRAETGPGVGAGAKFVYVYLRGGGADAMSEL